MLFYIYKDGKAFSYWQFNLSLKRIVKLSLTNKNPFKEIGFLSEQEILL